MDERAPLLTLVIPIWNEQETLDALAERVRAACDGIADLHWRVLYVDDGSRDDSARIMAAQARADGRFSVLRLSRNFGHQAAISAGLAHASGDAVVVMDGDLQDTPELIPEMVAQWRAGSSIVRAVRTDRAESGLRRLGFELFHRLFKWLSDVPEAAQTGVFCLMDRRAVDALNAMPEQHRFMPGLRTWIGFTQSEVTYSRDARAAGDAKQNLVRLTRYALDAFFSFSYKPLRLMTIGGLVISVLGFAVAVGFALRRLLGYEIAEIGFTTLIVCILCLGGVQLMALGIVGEYIGRIYDEVKRRPLYVVESWQPGAPGAASQAQAGAASESAPHDPSETARPAARQQVETPK